MRRFWLRCFFFFQAEDGIRDLLVTGVQTCALPILAQLASIRQMIGQVSHGSAGEYQADERAGVARLSWRVSGRRSGERRVGKECRSRWSRYHQKEEEEDWARAGV